jgi:hypothetical protein
MFVRKLHAALRDAELLRKERDILRRNLEAAGPGGHDVAVACFQCRNEQRFPSFDAVKALQFSSPCPKCGAEWLRRAIEGKGDELMRLEPKGKE